MRLGVLGKLTFLSFLNLTCAITIVALLSWYNNSSYVYSRLNSRFPTLAVLKAQQLDQYFNYTYSAVRSIATRLLIQRGVQDGLNQTTLSSAQNAGLESDLINGVQLLPNFLSARLLIQSDSSNISDWQTLLQYTPPSPEGRYYAPIVFGLLKSPPKEGIGNPFTLTGEKYIFVMNTVIPQSNERGYLQIVFDATALIGLLHQVNNQAEATTEYILISYLSDTTPHFQILLPILYHPEYAGRRYTVSSDLAAATMYESQDPIPAKPPNTLPVYNTGIVYDYRNFENQQATAGYAKLLLHLSPTQWGLMVQAPQREVEKPLNRLRNILLISSFSTLVLLLLVMIPLIWYCSRPIRNLRQVTRAAREAPISVEGLSVPDCSDLKIWFCIPACWLEDEISDLKESFIALAQSLNEQYASLDGKVAQRTIELQAAQNEAIAANTAKSAFLANMSHEIRSPLQGVIALADLGMLEDQNVSDEVKQTLATIKESGNHLLFLISDILDFSKIEAGHLVLEERVFSLGQGLINQLRISFRPKADEVGLRFDIITDPPELYQYRVQGDKHRLYQILSNLLSNAVKFTIAGSVVLRVTYTDPNWFQFSITDTGCGISTEVLARLFQPFTQADSSYSRKFGGTGLGLAVSKQLAGLMGGAIVVESQPDKGSTFTLRIPLHVVSDAIEESPVAVEDGTSITPVSQVSRLSQDSQLSTAHSVRNVMIADDNPVNRQVLSKMLNKCGIKQITLAENGQEALNIASKRVFDLILMDIAMPVRDGLYATRLLREGKYEGMIVALTAHIGAAEHEKALQSGVDHVLTKPITLKELRTFLQGIGK